MGLKLVCVLHGERDAINLTALNCGNQSHVHISRDEAVALEANNEVEWLKEPANRKEKGIVRVLKSRGALRDKACKLGAYLVQALRRKEPWAQLMHCDIEGVTLKSLYPPPPDGADQSLPACAQASIIVRNAGLAAASA